MSGDLSLLSTTSFRTVPLHVLRVHLIEIEISMGCVVKHSSAYFTNMTQGHPLY
jgi:hypothetical protein